MALWVHICSTFPSKPNPPRRRPEVDLNDLCPLGGSHDGAQLSAPQKHSTCQLLSSADASRATQAEEGGGGKTPGGGERQRNHPSPSGEGAAGWPLLRP